MTIVEAIVIARRVLAAVKNTTTSTEIGIGGVAAVKSTAENTKNQADIAAEVEDGLVLNRMTIQHLTTIRDLDQGHLPTIRNEKSPNMDADIVTVAIEMIIVGVGAEVAVEIMIDKEEAQHHLLLRSTM